MNLRFGARFKEQQAYYKRQKKRQMIIGRGANSKNIFVFNIFALKQVQEVEKPPT